MKLPAMKRHARVIKRKRAERDGGRRPAAGGNPTRCEAAHRLPRATTARMEPWISGELSLLPGSRCLDFSCFGIFFPRCRLRPVTAGHRDPCGIPKSKTMVCPSPRIALTNACAWDGSTIGFAGAGKKPLSAFDSRQKAGQGPPEPNPLSACNRLRDPLVC